MTGTGKCAAWAITILLFSVFLTSSPRADELSGWINLRGNNTESFEDGKKQGETSSISQDNQLTFSRPLTRTLTYQLSLRTRYSDTDFTDAEGETSSTYLRALNPAIDLSLNTPIYSVTAGYLRDEQWSTKSLKNESRKTFDNIYTRFNIYPENIPSLSAQFDRGRNFDHLSDQKIDETSTQYTVNSTYKLPSDVLSLSYDITYSRIVAETPLLKTTEFTSDSFNGIYDIGHSRFFWGDKGSVFVGYHGNYRWNEQEQTVEETGEVLFRRLPFGGLYAQGTDLEPDVDTLETTGWSSLVDEDFDSTVNINIGKDKFHNIGIWIPSDKPVDRLFIYVDRDTGTDINLTRRENWEVYWSNFNQTGTWTEVPLKAVTVKEVNVAQDFRHRYEIEFLSPRSASYFKAVNLEAVNALGVSDVFVTEIEAHGTDTVPDTGILSDDSQAYESGLNIITTVSPREKVSLTFDYSINRADEDIDSFSDSFTGLFQNIFSDSVDEQNEDFSSRINRNYGASARWLTHRLLTTFLSYRRSESFDNLEVTDSDVNTYNLTFRYTPLPTLGTSLILTRNENLNFGEDTITDNSAILSVDSKLYEDIHMTTDFTYTQTERFDTEENPDAGSDSTAYSVRGIIDAAFTKELFANFRYNFFWVSSDDEDEDAIDSQGASAWITYRPGRLINLTGLFSIDSSDGETTTTEGLSIDWLPFPAIQLTSSYRHTDFPGEETLDTFSSIGNWRITKFLSAWISYNYRKRKEDKEFEDHNVSANLNCRF